MNAQTEVSTAALARHVLRPLEDMNAPVQIILCTVKTAHLVSIYFTVDRHSKIITITIAQTTTSDWVSGIEVQNPIKLSQLKSRITFHWQ